MCRHFSEYDAMNLRINEYLIIALLFAAALSLVGCAQSGSLSNCSSKERNTWPIPKSWLKEQVSLGQVELSQTRNKLSINIQGQEWIAFRDQIQEGDQIWFYSGMRECPPSDFGCAPPGGEGLILLRNCLVIAQITLVYIN